jgi:transposase
MCGSESISPSGFKQGRDFAARLGLVPKQESTGDRTKLGRISKRGNKYSHPLCASCPRRPPAASRGGDARLVAMDRAGFQALGAS